MAGDKKDKICGICVKRDDCDYESPVGETILIKCLDFASKENPEDKK